MDRIASLTWRHPRAVLAGVGVFVALAIGFGHDVESHLKAAGFTDAASQSERANALLRGALGFDPTPQIALLVRPRGGGPLQLSRPAVRAEIQRIVRGLAHARHVGRVADPLRAPGLIAHDGRAAVVAGYLTSADVENDGAATAHDAARLTRSRTLSVLIGGFAPSFQEVNDQTRTDLTKAELIAFPVLAVLLLIVFRGAVAALIPLLVGGASIVGTLLMLRILSGFVSTSLFGLNIASGLSLGLAVDYALLMVTRYREEVEGGASPEQAHRQTVATAGRTAVFSGLTVAASMAALIAFPQRFLYSVGAAGAAVGLLAATVALLAVPSLLALLGERVNALSIRRSRALSAESDRWYRLARGVMRRPVAVAVASAAALLAVASPLRTTVLTGPSAQAVPPNQPSYRANAAIQRAFGRGIIEPITVIARGPADPAALARLQARLGAVPGIASTRGFQRASAGLAYAELTPRGPALSAASRHAVEAIRRLSAPSGARLLVTGNTASFVDEEHSLLSHLPVVAVIIVATTLLLLFALTGSVLLPVKSLVMNALTLAATLGAVVLSFQHGWLTGALSYTGPAAVEINSLVFLFAVIFGLATDYAVLVIARIKEQHDRGVRNAEAVAVGIARTGRVISAAALMIAVVFAAFAVSSVFFMKEIAVGQAFGVLVDATVVRALLVPALMRLLGDWNWWAPAPLRRAHRRFGLQEG